MRILLCEDEKEMSKALEAVLKYNKYSVDVVFDGEEALEYLSAGNYDAVVLDIMMPKLDGIEVLKRTRAKGNAVPIIMLTAKSQIDDKVMGLDLGANDYLTKPFQTKELLARIRAITRVKSEVVSSSVIEFGNLKLNRASFELSTEKEVIKLTNKEYQVIEMLMMNSKNVISTEMFMEKIWGYDSEAEINVVWVYVSNIRRKFLKLGANVEIKATRNVGYSLEEK